MDIKKGQKLYHFGYGPLTVTNVVFGNNGTYIETVDDFPNGYRVKDGKRESSQTWMIEVIGHWLFTTPEEVGNENNNFDWEKCWPSYSHAPVLPVDNARDYDNWHQYYVDNGYLVKKSKAAKKEADLGVKKDDSEAELGVKKAKDSVEANIGVIKEAELKVVKE